jgi:hypothetical protein
MVQGHSYCLILAASVFGVGQWRQQVPPRYWHLPTKLRVASQDTVIIFVILDLQTVCNVSVGTSHKSNNL